MKLYSDVERVDRELRARGKAPHAPLSPADLAALDQLHYGHAHTRTKFMARAKIEQRP